MYEVVHNDHQSSLKPYGLIAACLAAVICFSTYVTWQSSKEKEIKQQAWKAAFTHQSGNMIGQSFNYTFPEHEGRVLLLHTDSDGLVDKVHLHTGEVIDLNAKEALPKHQLDYFGASNRTDLMNKIRSIEEKSLAPNKEKPDLVF